MARARILIPIALVSLAACGTKPAARGGDSVAVRPAAPRDSAAASVGDSETAVRAPGDHPVFAVTWMDGGVTEAEPIAVVGEDGAFEEPPSDDSAEVAAFDSAWLRPGHRYTVLAAGRAAGTMTIRPAEAGGCNANAVRVDPRVSAVPPGRAALAAGFPVPPGPPLRRDASADERGAMAALLRDAVVRRGGAKAWRDDAEVQAEEIAMPGGRAMLVGSAVVRLDRDDVAAPVNAAFIIAERAESGAWRPVMIWEHPASDPGADYPLVRRLLDAADLDGDGVPEIVARTDLSEEWQYTVYRHGPRGWTQAVEVSGGGC